MLTFISTAGLNYYSLAVVCYVCYTNEHYFMQILLYAASIRTTRHYSIQLIS